MLPFAILCSLAGVLSQTTSTVTVGDDSSFDPPTVSAGMDDIIDFVFTGLKQHSVTESTLANPCQPREGGFNSGLTSLSNSTDSSDAPVWKLRITNASIPIYFFCTHSTHCNAGMVGAINPPSQEMYSSLVSVARDTASTVTSQIPYAATGIGAVALQTPVPSSVGTGILAARASGTGAGPPGTTTKPPGTGTTRPLGTSTTRPLGTSTTRPPSTRTPTSNNKKSNTGAIVGGAVGAALGAGLVIIIGVVLLLFRRRRRRRDSKDPPSQMDQPYNTPPTAGMTEGGMSEHANVKPNSGIIPNAISSPPHRQISPSGVWSTDNEESRLGGYPQPPYASNRNTEYTVSNPDEDQSSPGSDRPSDRGQKYSGTDIHSLAKEVAAVMRQNNTEVSGEGTSSGSRQAMETTAENKVRLYHEEPPPQYQESE
ncbi:hypothetical protein BDP27DRAFT_1367415 [Rhodocollybia butyracea]|uniref:Uncharacterized protein n=1 Tax=Rhodocollybia butyracea TaxID=206335 RepID=A0A9P5U201_9AGAR|nr:hypothetical protein BDP27DRAFT_1367415 [Rhodocollybia butyracea]